MSSSRLPRSITLSVPPAEQWTLHHVLCHRIERASRGKVGIGGDPPPLELCEAFETLEAGDTRFTAVQLEAIQDVLAEYHHCTDWWEVDRTRIERLLHHVSSGLEAVRTDPESTR
ncbi:hypothetical protein OB955_13625 [Halobacteria archaeon AArc-m2/3/4]|uniref:Uncharacterized protein n=1 Tax=Natronoglomus mannanivorans TaxID=2979990 RepID=A0AAP3E1Q7_9EURY|nr:hypothetical protein [Halobacteria archaeon AArc-xg1-1]MCU4973774.1 hypothetical protein [Halobacteria archaeon AArc-m2/3/4]